MSDGWLSGAPRRPIPELAEVARRPAPPRMVSFRDRPRPLPPVPTLVLARCEAVCSRNGRSKSGLLPRGATRCRGLGAHSEAEEVVEVVLLLLPLQAHVVLDPLAFAHPRAGVHVDDRVDDGSEGGNRAAETEEVPDGVDRPAPFRRRRLVV